MIDEAQIQYLERLARIRLSPEQRAEFREEIGRILSYMESLAAIDDAPASTGDATPAMGDASASAGGTSAAVAASGARPGSGTFGSADCRPDDLRPSLPRASLLAMSPQATEEYMTVPRAVQ